MLVKVIRWHIVNKDFWAVDLFYDSDRSFLRHISPVTIVYITCLQLKQNIPTVWFSDQEDTIMHFPHLNRNLQENLSLTDLWFRINDY